MMVEIAASAPVILLGTLGMTGLASVACIPALPASTRMHRAWTRTVSPSKCSTTTSAQPEILGTGTATTKITSLNAVCHIIARVYLAWGFRSDRERHILASRLP